MSERWTAVPGWEGYEVSDLGRVRNRRGLVLRQRLVDGYYRTFFYKDNVRYVVWPHRVVMWGFVGPCPPGLEVCHGDGDSTNNCLSNLRYDTRANNRRDTIAHGRDPMLSRTRCPRLHLLVAPNLVPSALKRNLRGCLACQRAHSRRGHAARSGRPVLDMKVLSDQFYVELGFAEDLEILGARSAAQAVHNAYQLGVLSVG